MSLSKSCRHVWQLETEDAWLERRQKGLGASDAPVVLGVSPHKTPYQLWSEKVGLVEPPDLSDREWIEWGQHLEPLIAKVYGERSGRNIKVWPQYGLIQHATRDWMLCTPDATQEDGERDTGLLQIKTTGAFRAKEWEDEPPLYYQVQVQHELEVTGTQWATLAVLVGGQKLLWFDVERNEKFITAMVEAEEEFWRRVVEEDPPEVDESPDTSKLLFKLHPQDNGEAVALPPPAAIWDEELVTVKGQLKELESQRRLLENRIKAAIGDATWGVLQDGARYSYKTQTTNYSAKEASTATFRILRKETTK